jgi:hypothetical protein
MRIAAVVLARLEAVGRAVYFILGPWIDNRLGILTGRDLKVFGAHVVAGSSLEELVSSRAGSVAWTVEHDEVIWASEVVAKADTGEEYRWEISHAAPRQWLPVQSVYITPLNRAAARLLPELLPKELRDVHLIPLSRYGSGVIYDVAHPDKNMEHYGPWLRKRFPDLFDADGSFRLDAERLRRHHGSTGGPTLIRPPWVK